MESLRQQKVNKLLAKELAEIFRGESKNMFDGGFITVTGVRVSPDLGVAKVYVSIMPSCRVFISRSSHSEDMSVAPALSKCEEAATSCAGYQTVARYDVGVS